MILWLQNQCTAGNDNNNNKLCNLLIIIIAQFKSVSSLLNYVSTVCFVIQQISVAPHIEHSIACAAQKCSAYTWSAVLPVKMPKVKVSYSNKAKVYEK